MNRRDVLGLSATAALGLIFSPTRVFAQMQPPDPEMGVLSAYMSAAGNRELPAEAAEQAKHRLLDTLASMVSGSELPPGRAALRYIGSHAGKGAATIVGSALTAAREK
jgi:2-methylcitrate dehydratase PrpD